MHEIDDDKLTRELRSALGARARSVEAGDARQRVALARARAGGRRGRPGAIVGLAAALLIALVAGIGIAWRLETRGVAVGPSGSTSALPSATESATVSPLPTPTLTSSPSATPARTPLTPGFHLTGSMTTVQPVSALLTGGQVLFVDNAGPVSEMGPWSELYDPATGQFRQAGRLPTVRGYETVTPLLDGRALVVGGIDGDQPNPLAEADLFDPATGEFTRTGSLSTRRLGHTASRLPDGRVLVAGGYTQGGDPSSDTWAGAALASAEIFDPATGKFTPAGSMNAPRRDQTATGLLDGRVFLFGGCGADICANGGVALATAEIYDPETGRFTPTGSAKVGRWGHTATLLSDGRVLVTGGSTNPEGGDTGRLLASAEIYDPRTGTFSSAGSMSMVRVEHTATPLTDGRVLITGGRSGAFESANATASVEIFDPRTRKFTPAGMLTFARAGQTATLLPGGRVLIAGGYVADQSVPIAPGRGVWRSVLTAELYQP